MGVYDIYEGVQLKLGKCELINYKIGDKTDIPDGIYVGYEGCVVIKDGKFIAQYSSLQNKWGGFIKCSEVISKDNPVSQAIKDMDNKEA